jgi:hypothetical protein
MFADCQNLEQQLVSWWREAMIEALDLEPELRQSSSHFLRYVYGVFSKQYAILLGKITPF